MSNLIKNFYNSLPEKKGFWSGIGLSFLCFIIFDIIALMLCFIQPIGDLGAGTWVALVNMFVFPVLIVILGITAWKKNLKIVFNWIILIVILFFAFMIFSVSKDFYVRNVSIKKYAQAHVLVNYPDYAVKNFKVRYNWYSNTYTVTYTDGKTERQLMYNHNKQLNYDEFAK